MPWVSEDEWKYARDKHKKLRDQVVQIIALTFVFGALFGALGYRLTDNAFILDQNISAHLKLERN